jgi:hypothetical protein
MHTWRVGVHFAIGIETMNRLPRAGSDAAVLDIIQEEVEQKWEVSPIFHPKNFC